MSDRNYSDENLMHMIEDLFLKQRRQMHAHREFPRFPEEPEDYRGPFFPRRPPMARERILTLIALDEPVSQKKLSLCLDIRPQSLSEALAKLERDGYIVRIKNEEDKRETLVSLTEKGRARSEEVEAARAAHISDFFSPLSPDERKTLFSLLEKLLSDTFTD